MRTFVVEDFDKVIEPGLLCYWLALFWMYRRKLFLKI
jgi:hypothetical protein